MITKLKQVYYCEYCKKPKLAKWAANLHEKHCTANPHRECRVCGSKRVDIVLVNNTVEYVKEALVEHRRNRCPKRRDEEDKAFLDDMLDMIECPVCLFSILRQANVLQEKEFHEYSFERELTDYRNREAERENMGGCFPY